MHAAVVGSGPAGTACAKALLRRGIRVTLLDVGEELDPGRQKLVSELRDRPPSLWDAQSVARATDNPSVATRQIPRKLQFGSDYFYALDRADWPVEADGVAATTSFALGGFSVAWGAAMLPADDCDMGGWPFGRSALEESYRRVLADMPMSATEDLLARSFPVYRDGTAALKQPKQAARLGADLLRAETRGPFAPFLHGQSRLAVQVGDAPRQRGCYYCGICLSGCPIDAIYSTARDIVRLAADGALRYEAGTLVESVRELDDRVEVSIVRRDGIRDSMRFDRVFIGAGAINSTRIVMRSLAMYGRAVRLNDSQKFVVPFLRLVGDPIQWPNMNALASLFIEAKLPSLSDHWIHIQISAVNDLVLKRLKFDPHSASRLRRALLQPMLSRLMIAWCSLHSDHSSQLELTLNAGQAEHPVLRIRNVINPRTSGAIRKVSWGLARAGLGFRSLFLAPFAAASLPAAGCHYGGSFPMGREGGSDLLGRPLGMQRTHLVDASTFPSIPATTIVLQIMANADRIATAVPADA